VLRLKLRLLSCILLVQVYAEPVAFLLLFMGRSMGSYGQKYGQFLPRFRLTNGMGAE